MNNLQQTPSLPILYSFRRCPYAIRARMMLAASGISFELREVHLRKKPPQMLSLSPKGTVPVLYLSNENRVIDESLDIMRWAINCADSRIAKTLASDIDWHTSALLVQNDGAFKRALDAYKYPQKDKSANAIEDTAHAMKPDDALKHCLAFIGELEVCLANKPWLGGLRFTPLDVAIFPFIRQFHLVDERVLTKTTFPHVFQWLSILLRSELFAVVMSKHHPWSEGDVSVVYDRGVFSPQEPTGSGAQVRVAAFYRFVKIDDCEALRIELKSHVNRLGLRGSVLLAEEGINGMLAGTPDNIDAFVGVLAQDPRFKTLSLKFQHCSAMPFHHTKVRVKKEIVASKDIRIDALSYPHGRLGPDAWDALIKDPDVILIDVRNDYEFELGHFRGARNPRTKSFGEFARFVETNLAANGRQKIAMYCTGGIRCEKAAVIMRELGFSEVYQLEGGILNYLEQRRYSTENNDALPNMWQGDCFVFDERIAVDSKLEPVAKTHHCARCGRPCHPADGCIICNIDPAA